jgi:hypothetical protein
LTPEELPFLRFEAEAQACFDAWRGNLEQTLRAEEDHPVLLSHVAKYRSLMTSKSPSGTFCGQEVNRERDALGSARGTPS